VSQDRHLGAIRGATTVDLDDATAIRAATAELLRRIVALNALAPSDILSALFTVTAVS
jgi:chorismate mutase